jgi:hypothetical protein
MDYVDVLCRLVGQTPEHRALAQRVSRQFHKWADLPGVPLEELTEIVAPLVTAYRLGDPNEVVRFMARLCDRPGRLMEWDDDRRRGLLESALASPVLVRAVRFAVLGREAFVENIRNEAGER